MEWAEAGSVLERAFERAGVSRDSLTLANLVWYRPPGDELLGKPWEMEAIRACAPFNEELVRERAPRCILALGGLPFRELSGLGGGEKTGILACRGFILPGFWFPGIPVVGTYHPSFLRRGSKEKSKEGAKVKSEAAGGGTQGMALLGAVVRDLLLALQVAREGPPPFLHDPYILGGTLDDWETFYLDARNHPELVISYDWEWPRSARLLSEEEIENGEHERNIIQGQMSLRPGQAIVSPFTPELLPIWRKILALPNPKLDWNGRKADRPLALEYGLELAGELHDGMDLWHHAQPDLPRGLQYATSFFCPEVGPWKHIIGSDPLLYGAYDVDMPLRVYYGLRKSLGLIRHPVSGRSLWDGYREQVVLLSPVLDEMKAHGIPVNEEKRLGLDQEFEGELVKISNRMQEVHPEELRNVEPKEGFKRKQKGLPLACLKAAGQGTLFGSSSPRSEEDIGPTNESGGKIEGSGGEPSARLRPNREGTSEGERASRSASGSEPSSGGPKEPDDQERTSERVVDPASGQLYGVRTFRDSKTKEEVRRWARILPFKPSSEQVLRYIKAKGWEVHLHPKTKNETADELAIRKTLREHPSDPLLPLILEYREVSQAKHTFIEAWTPGRDGCVHSTFGFKPATGQLSSEGPNAQNFPKHSELARRMRRMIEARAGRTFLSFDWKSFHVLTTGFEAGCPVYMRLARMDMHTFFALVGLLKVESPGRLLELPDEELSAKLKWYRKQPKVYSSFTCQAHPGGMTLGEIRDERAKRAILGIGFGQTGVGLFRRNPESFSSQREAVYCVDQLRETVSPRIFSWHSEVRREADAHHALLTRAGYWRQFWDVYSKRKVPSWWEPRKGQEVLERGGQRWLLGPGDDHEACVAYRPANDAFAIKRKVMVELGRDGLAREFGLMNEIHDDLDFELDFSLEPAKVERCIEEVKGRMEAPALFLRSPLAPGGLWCQVEVKVGRNLDFRSPENPEGMEEIKV